MTMPSTEQAIRLKMSVFNARGEELARLKALRAKINRSIDEIEAELLQELAELDSSEVLTDKYVITRTNPTRSYEWFQNRVEAFRPLLTDKEWEDCVIEETKYKVQTRKVLALAEKRGGELKRQVEASYLVHLAGPPHVNVMERADA